MKYLRNILIETKSSPCIVVDVQPEYDKFIGNKKYLIMDFLNKQTGPILRLVNAEETGLSNDSNESISFYWEEAGFNEENWNRVITIDKGYGYIRDWMDVEIDQSIIIRTIRYMYQHKINDIRDIDLETISELVGENVFEQYGATWFHDSAFIINWLSIETLKKFSGGYIMGGAKNECLREVELLMSAFNIKTTRIEKLIY